MERVLHHLVAILFGMFLFGLVCLVLTTAASFAYDLYHEKSRLAVESMADRKAETSKPCHTDEDCVKVGNSPVPMVCVDGLCEATKYVTDRDILHVVPWMVAILFVSPLAALLALIGIVAPKRFAGMLLVRVSQKALWVGVVYLPIAVIPWVVWMVMLNT